MKRIVTIIVCLLTGITLWADDVLTADSIDEYSQPRQRSFNALRYSLDDYHRYSGDSLSRGLSMIDIGGGLMTASDNNQNNQPLTLMHLRYGRQINPFSTLRIGVDGGFGLIGRFSGGLYNTVNGQVALGADYLYSLSSHLMGYRPERKLDVSAVVGVAAAYSRRFNSRTEMLDHQLRDHHLSARLRAGVQMKFFASPQSAIAIEPYLFLSSRAYDLIQPSYERYRYRMGAGVDVSYVYYLRNRLTPEGSEGTFMHRFSRSQRYLAGDVGDVLRHHPITVGLMSGATGINGHGREFSQSYGPGITASIGWWLSPALGIRGSMGSDNIDWSQLTTRINKSIYRHAGFDLMLNPLGFSRNSHWRAPAGIALLAGYEAGRFRQTGSSDIPAFGYHTSVNLWARLSDNLRLTIEPGYTRLTNRGEGSSPVTDSYTRLDIGLEMMIDGKEELSTLNPQLSTKNFPLGYFIGASGGWNFTYRYGREANYEEWLKNALFMAGYEYTPLHGVRLSAEYVNNHFRNGIRKEWQSRWLVSADYRLSLNTLLWGVNPSRRWNALLNIGPSVAFGGSQPTAGANAGLELDYRVSKHFSLFAAHNGYCFPKKLNETEQTAGSNITSTYNIGVIYHFENLVEPMLQVSGADTIGRRWTVGVASGYHFSNRSNRLPGGTHNGNFAAMLNCKLTPIVDIRLAAEYLSYNYAGRRVYTLTSGSSKGLQFSDMAVTTARLLSASLAADYDLLGLVNKSPRRRLSLTVLAGMVVTAYLGESSTIPTEREDYTVSDDGAATKMTPAVLLGSELKFQLTNHLSVGAVYHYYWYGISTPQWLYNIGGQRTSPGNLSSLSFMLGYRL